MTSTSRPLFVSQGRWAGLTAQAHVTTPLGPALLVASDTGLAGLWFDGQAHHPLAPVQLDDDAGGSPGAADVLPDHFDLPEAPSHPMLAPAIAQLDDYWRGERRHFELALDLRGTAFQRAVWQQLLVITCGDTSTYGAVATQIGKTAAVRAVGAAVGRNPVSVIVPCHRVVGGSGDLTGYAGGLHRKHALLTLEGVALGDTGLVAAALARRRPTPMAVGTGKMMASPGPGPTTLQMPLDLTPTPSALVHTASRGSAT